MLPALGQSAVQNDSGQFQAARPKARKFEHQVHFCNQEQRIQTANQRHREQYFPGSADELATAVGNTSPMAQG